MLKILSHLLTGGLVTQKSFCPPLPGHCLALPDLLPEVPCSSASCDACARVCPTDAIGMEPDTSGAEISIDLGACIACGLCIETCPDGVIVKNLSTRTAVTRREDLKVLRKKTESASNPSEQGALFSRSVAVRVVSTGCSACDSEVAAAFNPIFDAERFGVQLVASPRAADILLVTGPVPTGMQEALRRSYDAMPEPRRVIAAGSCAISGGVHRGGYACADGVSEVIPVDVFVPGCPPHPWSIIHGIGKVMGLTAP
ncbi:MAG: NADH-quinone oxidoreductase subunit NuoB [Candidatus Obscuribacterales bacterium]